MRNNRLPKNAPKLELTCSKRLYKEYVRYNCTIAAKKSEPLMQYNIVYRIHTLQLYYKQL